MYPLVSVVVPIFNVKKYIDRGLANLFNQQYSNFEVLLIDDGSTDGSRELCEDWARQKQNVKVFHKENEGAGSARNIGLLNAKGDYVYFFDIDDLIDECLLSYNVEIMEKKQVDLVLFGFKTVSLNRDNYEESIFFQERLITSNEELASIYVDALVLVRNGNGFVWNKFYRRSFLQDNQICFENQRIQQDEIFNLKVYRHAQRVYISPFLFYCYYIYETGNTRSRFIADRFDCYKSVYNAFRELQAYWKIKDVRFDEYLYKRFYGNIGQCLRFNLFHPACSWNLTEKKRELSRVMNDIVTQETVHYMLSHKLLGVEEHIYLKLYLMRNMWVLKRCVTFFSMLRVLKRRMTRLIELL